MSRVHVIFVSKVDNSGTIVFDVVSPDFSEDETKDEVIGELALDFHSNAFRFYPVSHLQDAFCPPEYFEKYDNDLDSVDEACRQQGLRYIPWSHRIYRKAVKVLQQKVLQ